MQTLGYIPPEAFDLALEVSGVLLSSTNPIDSWNPDGEPVTF